jgi:hypothetical protein
MWLFSRLGFYSAVAVPGRPGTLVVRARVRSDARNLARLLKQETGQTYRVERTPHRDYLYRLTMPVDVWATAVARLAVEVSYPNFKAAVQGDPVRDGAYHECWNAMWQLQQKKRSKPRHARRRAGQHNNEPRPARLF